MLRVALPTQTATQTESDNASGQEPWDDAVVEPPRPLAMVERTSRRNVRRGHVWGSRPAFQIAPIHAKNSAEPTGWGAICGRHTDPNNPRLPCRGLVFLWAVSRGVSAAIEALACGWSGHCRLVFQSESDACEHGRSADEPV